MITRIKIDSFKSLLGVELYFGPFTCIAGANAAGKSNLFDAIMFLANLADMTILEAAKSIRSEEEKHSNIKDVFFKSADKNHDYMSFEVDMLVPEIGVDDLGQTATAKITSLRYKLKLKFNGTNKTSDQQLPIEIVEEWLEPMTRDAAKKSIGFAHDRCWLNSVLKGKRSGDFISTEDGKIKLHQDTKDQDRSRGRAAEFVSNKMPRTLLSTVTAESPTAFIVRQEMRNWQMLQFEPSALRQPNSFHEIINSRIEADGYYLPATLYRLATDSKEDIYQQLTNKLKGVVEDVKMIGVDKDEKRELLTLTVTFKNGLTLPAQSLSDGTLRFLGLSVIQEDSRNGVICMEEPENGINPKKIPEIVSLLRDMALDTEFEAGTDNPIRQVIINTHSPKLIGEVPEDSLYLACEKEKYDDSLGMKVHYTTFSVLPNTHLLRIKKMDLPTTSLDVMLAYLDGAGNPRSSIPDLSKRSKSNRINYTVRDNINEQLSLSLFSNEQ